MLKIASLSVLLWLLLFTLRVTQIGGIDPTYKEPGTETLLWLREGLTGLIDSLLPYPHSALLSGILLGSQERLPHYLKDQLQATSTIHMVVVSGQNLTMLAGFIMGLASLLGRRKAIFLTLAMIVFYSVLTGLQIPVIRAAIMTSLAFMAQLLGREKMAGWILMLTAGGMLLYNPHWLLNVSFQLSFLATVGVVMVAPLFLNLFRRVPEVLRQDLAVTLAAQAMVLPVIAYNFQQISLIGVVSNLLILWTIPLVMVSGMVSVVAVLIDPLLGQIVSLVPGVLLAYFISLVGIFAKLPGASFRIGETVIIMWLGYYIFLGSWLWRLTIRQRIEPGGDDKVLALHPET